MDGFVAASGTVDDGRDPSIMTLSDHDNHLYIRDDSGGLLVGCFEPMGKPIKPGILDETFEFGLLPEDWEGYPLRKDYQFPREYHGIPGTTELDWQQKPDYPM